MILSALYYPQTGIQSADLMKQALLLWDRVEYITPYSGFVADYSAQPKMGRDSLTATDARLMHEAMELIGQPYVLTTDTNAIRRWPNTHSGTCTQRNTCRSIDT